MRRVARKKKKVNRKRRECVYVIGAGFSAGLGYPLTSDLLVRLWERADASLRDRLGAVIDFHHPRFNPLNFTSFPNVEELLSEMLVNDELFDASRQYVGDFTREQLKELERDLLGAIAAWFHELSKKVKHSAPKVEWLTQFRDRVRRERAAIISFNWDLIVDELLFGDDLDETSYGFSTGASSRPVLLKPHGSLNWFKEQEGRFLKGAKRVRIFDDENRGATFAFRGFRAPKSTRGRSYNPLIVPPVYLKKFDEAIFKEVWRKSTSALSTAKRVVFIGYSMPLADFHAQFIMRCGFYNQVRGEVATAGRTDATGKAQVTIVNPDRAAAQRIAAVVGPEYTCDWISTPAAEWIAGRSS